MLPPANPLFPSSSENIFSEIQSCIMMHKLLAATGTLLCCDVLLKTQQLSTFWIFSHSFVLIELCSTSMNLQFTWARDLLARGQRTDPTWRWGEGHELAFWLLRKAWEAVSSSITLRKILLLSNIASTGCSRIFSRSSGAEGGLGKESNEIQSNDSDLFLTHCCNCLRPSELWCFSFCIPPGGRKQKS